MSGLDLLVPSLVHACPMCFAGGNQNQDAFLYGSLFLMIVPVLAMGGLGYWAYRRLTAPEAEGYDNEGAETSGLGHGHGQAQAQAQDVKVADLTDPKPAGAGVVLRIAPRR